MSGRVAVVMSDAVSKEVNVLKRCAVCKIDLKGRFAFIDEEFLALTGYSYEEILGKPVAGILEPASRELITRLMSGRSHYEAVYDSAPLTLINKNKQPVNVSATMFLNFSGGNPVNFQLILSPQAVSQKVGTPAANDDYLADFINRLMALDTANDWPGVLNALLKLSSAGQAAWYGFEKGNLIPMAIATDNTNAQFVNKEISPATVWHHKIAESEEVYDFTEGASVQKAVESSQSAPNEFISTFHIHKDKYVLRFIYANEVDLSEAVKAINRTRLVIPLIIKLVTHSH